MKKSMVFLAIVFWAVTVTMPAGGAEQSSPGKVTPTLPVESSKQPFMHGTPKPDLVVTSITPLGEAYTIGERRGYAEEAITVEFTIMNKGLVATGRAGSNFIIDVAHSPQCEKDCTAPPGMTDFMAITNYQLNCNSFWSVSPTMSFRFLPPISVSTPLMAGETRTIRAKLVLPQCLQRSKLGKAASVFVIVDGSDDMGKQRSQVDESNEGNNKSATIIVRSMQ